MVQLWANELQRSISSCNARTRVSSSFWNERWKYGLIEFVYLFKQKQSWWNPENLAPFIELMYTQRRSELAFQNLWRRLRKVNVCVLSSSNTGEVTVFVNSFISWCSSSSTVWINDSVSTPEDLRPNTTTKFEHFDEDISPSPTWHIRIYSPLRRFPIPV